MHSRLGPRIAGHKSRIKKPHLRNQCVSSHHDSCGVFSLKKMNSQDQNDGPHGIIIRDFAQRVECEYFPYSCRRPNKFYEKHVCDARFCLHGKRHVPPAREPFALYDQNPSYGLHVHAKWRLRIVKSYLIATLPVRSSSWRRSVAALAKHAKCREWKDGHKSKGQHSGLMSSFGSQIPVWYLIC
jgi:hypothetical protein